MSIQSVDLLDEFREKAEGAARSASTVLDGIVRDISLERRRREVDRAITNYYDNMTEAEAEEQRAWGKFALQQFAKREK